MLAHHLAGHVAARILLEAGVQDRVGDEIADLVRVPLGNRLRRKRVVLFAAHGRVSTPAQDTWPYTKKGSPTVASLSIRDLDGCGQPWRLTTRGPSSRVKSPRLNSVVQRGRRCQVAHCRDVRRPRAARGHRCRSADGRTEDARPLSRQRRLPQPSYRRRGAVAALECLRHAALQAHHRVRRHALQRLADPEERAHGAGRARSRRARRDRRRASSSCTAPAAPTRASTRSAQVAHLDSGTNVPPAPLLRR